MGSYYAVLTKVDTAHKSFSQHFIFVCAQNYNVIYSLFSICQHSAPLRSGVHDKLNSWRANLLPNTHRATGEFRSLAGEVSYKTWIGMRGGDYCCFFFLRYCSSSSLSTVCKQHSVSHRVSGVCLHLREHLGSQRVCRWINSIQTEIFSLKNNLLQQKLKWDDCSFGLYWNSNGFAAYSTQFLSF